MKRKNLGYFIILLFLVLTRVTIVSALTEGNWVYSVFSTSGMYKGTPFAGTASIEKYNGNDKNVVIPSTIGGKNVSSISALGSSVISDNSNVVSITIPEGVISLQSYSNVLFKNLSNLTTINFPSTIKEINGKIYDNCPKLTNLNMPDNLVLQSDGSYRSIQEVTYTTTYDYDASLESFNSTNLFRKENGVSELLYDADLTEVAMKRAAELALYYDHTRPNGTASNLIWWNVAGAENIFASSGYATGHTTFAAWRDSKKGHREQMLKEEHKSIGIGVVRSNGNTFAVQIFSSKELKNNSVITGTKESTDNVQVSELNEVAFSLDIEGLDSDISLSVGDTIKPAKVVLYNSGFYSKVFINSSDVIWKSSDTNVFTVDDEGLITAKGVGTATLTAKVGAQIKTYTLTVAEKKLATPSDVMIDNDYNISFKTDKANHYRIELNLNNNNGSYAVEFLDLYFNANNYVNGVYSDNLKRNVEMAYNNHKDTLKSKTVSVYYYVKAIDYVDYFYWEEITSEESRSNEVSYTVEEEIKNGIYYNSDTNNYEYYKDGKIDNSYTYAESVDGIVYYFEKGKVTNSYNGVGKSKDGTLYYFKNSKQDTTYTCAKTVSGVVYYFEKGKVTNSYNGVRKANSGTLYYFKNSKQDTTYTYAESVDGVIYYFEKGKANIKYTGIGYSESKVKYKFVNGKVV